MRLTQTRYRLDEDVAMWLPSGWWVTLRNEFAQAPGVAVTVLESVADQLSAITAEATTARGRDAQALSDKLFSCVFDGAGPDYRR